LTRLALREGGAIRPILSSLRSPNRTVYWERVRDRAHGLETREGSIADDEPGGRRNSRNAHAAHDVGDPYKGV